MWYFCLCSRMLTFLIPSDIIHLCALSAFTFAFTITGMLKFSQNADYHHSCSVKPGHHHPSWTGRYTVWFSTALTQCMLSYCWIRHSLYNLASTVHTTPPAQKLQFSPLLCNLRTWQPASTMWGMADLWTHKGITTVRPSNFKQS